MSVAAERSAGVRHGRPGLPAERWLAAFVVLAQGFYFPMAMGFSPGTILAVLLTPVWLRTALGYCGARSLLVLTAGALLSGAAVAAFRAADHRISLAEAGAAVAMMVTIGAGTAILLWARSILGTAKVAVLFGLAMGASGVVRTSELSATNPVKFMYALPIALILLGLAHRWPARSAQVVAVLVVGGLCALFEFRSLLGTCLVAALLLAWQGRPRHARPARNAALMGGLLVAIAAAVYFTVTTLLVDGTFGVELQERSTMQIAQSGSLIIGGRPEIAATWALLGHAPLGFGLGVAPNGFDIAIAKQGLWSIGYDPNNGYVHHYLFGPRFELHSVAGDLWVRYGPIGALLAGWLCVLFIRGLVRRLAAQRATGLVLIVSIWNIWNLFFSPILSSLTILILGLAILLEATPRPVSSAVPARDRAPYGHRARPPSSAGTDPALTPGR